MLVALILLGGIIAWLMDSGHLRVYPAVAFIIGGIWGWGIFGLSMLDNIQRLYKEETSND